MKAFPRILAGLCMLAPGLSLAESAADDTDFPDMNNPGSIAEQYQQDRDRKAYLFQIPGMDAVMTPWGNARSKLDENHAFKPTASFTHLYQNASDTVGPEDDAAAYEIVVDGTWTFLGRDTEAPKQLGFEFLYRDVTSDLPPVALFTQVGFLLSDHSSLWRSRPNHRPALATAQVH